LECTEAGFGVGEIVSGLLNNGSESGTEVADEDVKITSVMGNNPGFNARIPRSKAECQHKLDVGVVFGHAKNETASCNFESNCIMASGD